MADIRLEFLTTGSVRIRPLMRSQPFSAVAPLRLLKALRDTAWSEPLPVGIFLVHHPEGLFLLDTGQSPLCNTPGFLPTLALFDKKLSTFDIEPKDGLMAQLGARGIHATDITAVILTHLHGDHAGGLEDLLSQAPDLPVYISREHWNAFGKRPIQASLRGAAPNHWPKPFNPRIVDFLDRPVGPWRQSFPITKDGRLVIVDTSGHVPGHVSLIVSRSRLDDESSLVYFLPGDATYGLDVLDKEEPDGINDDPVRALETLRKIKEFARSRDVCVIPSHDPQAAQILANNTVYKPTANL